MNTLSNDSDRYQAVMADPALPQKWRERFVFFQKYGAPGSPEYRTASRALSPGKRILVNMFVNMSFIAFFFHIIYFFVLGMWRKALTLIGVIVAANVVVLVIEIALHLSGSICNGIERGIGIALMLMICQIANYSYYLERVKGDNGWNPFKGMRMW